MCQQALKTGHPADTTQDETALVEVARNDATAFATLYRRYVTPIYRYLYSRVGNTDDAEDLTAQVFTAALERLPGYRHRGNFPAWLFTIARHKLADHFRRQRPHLPLDAIPDPPQQAESDLLSQMVADERLRCLSALVARLEPEEQELLRLRFAAGLTYAQMAAVLGRSEAALKMALHRLLRRLRDQWEAEI